jgi:hypothetical protein
LNPLLKDAPDRLALALRSPTLLQNLDLAVQSYLRDACRIFNLKIFKVEIYERAIEPEFTEIFDDLERAQDEKKSASKIEAQKQKDLKTGRKNDVLADLEYARPNHVHYFTNRVELGDQSVYPKLQRVSKILGCFSESECKKLIDELERTSAPLDTDQHTGYRIRVQVKAMDSMGREVNTEDEYDTNEVDAAYLKLINVPCLYDMGAAPSDPADA